MYIARKAYPAMTNLILHISLAFLNFRKHLNLLVPRGFSVAADSDLGEFLLG